MAVAGAARRRDEPVVNGPSCSHSQTADDTGAPSAGRLRRNGHAERVAMADEGGRLGAGRVPPVAAAGRTVLLALLAALLAVPAGCIEMDPCKERSCYPATGNLLIGRGHRLSATSTCGVSDVDRYCIVSHLDDPHKCFDCDSRTAYDPVHNRQSHRIQNIITENLDERRERWWQAENGKQNVSIRLNLEAEFHFTHLVITFKTFRPAAMLIERSADFGNTWKVYRYFAQDCETLFPGVPLGPPRKHSDVVCTDKYSNVAPSTGGEVVLKVLSPHIPLENPYSA